MNSLNVIFAHDLEMGFGKKHTLPWRIPEDMAFFSATTKGDPPEGKQNAVIMGRKTFMSLPEKYRPLPDRINLILTRDPTRVSSEIANSFGPRLHEVKDQPFYVRESIDSALKWCDSNSHIVHDVFIIGGADVIGEALTKYDLDAIFVTKVLDTFDCDVVLTKGVDVLRKMNDETCYKHALLLSGDNFRIFKYWPVCGVEDGHMEELEKDMKALEAVDHPQHYHPGVYEAINVIEAWELGFSLGNAVKYISRAGKKDPAKEVEDLNKAIWYIQRHIDMLLKQ